MRSVVSIDSLVAATLLTTRSETYLPPSLYLTNSLGYLIICQVSKESEAPPCG